MVSLMAVVALAPLAGEETDAAVGDGGTYSYTLTYHADQMANTAAQETQLTVDGMTPISHSSGSTQLTLENEGSWGFNTTTGLGPFNSFYAAFDAENGNAYVATLDPYDLSKRIDGTDLGTDSTYNVMWILPTVYWTIANGNITLTNDPTSGGTAYAHTINGDVYNYIAIGVYEASTSTIGSDTVLTSKTGVAPINNTSKTDLRQYAHNYTMNETLGGSESMLWNYYQWELYRCCAFIVMEGFNSQAIVGNGAIFEQKNTGLLNSAGPYAGDNGAYTDALSQTLKSPSKLFIENSWGGVAELVDGILINGSYNCYIDSFNPPTDSTTTTDPNINYQQWRVKSGYPSGIINSSVMWAMSNYSSDGSATTGLCDNMYTSDANGSVIYVGGNAGGTAGDVGISRVSAQAAAANAFYGTRLAFVFNDLFETAAVTIESDGTGYGSIGETVNVNVETGSEIVINNNVITIGDTTVTATPLPDTSDYEYSFDGWFNGSTQLQTGDTVDEDMTITAKFSRAAILTVTLDAGKGTVSSSSLTVVEGQPIGDLPTPTPKAGYTFTGWFDSEGNEVTSETIVTETESFTLYAQYELDDSLKPVKAMTDLLPLIFVVGIIILMIGTAFYYYRP